MLKTTSDDGSSRCYIINYNCAGHFFSLQTHKIWGPFLVVAPASTLHNWQQEVSRFVPRFKVWLVSCLLF